MVEALGSPLTQRADYTQKHNAGLGRYGWLRLTPAYSLKVVNEILMQYDSVSDVNVFDPFCGTATTALCASYHGHTAVTIDINPFLIWLGQTKTDIYSPELILDVRQEGQDLLDAIRAGKTSESPVPPIHNIKRWWPPDTLDFLCKLKGAIDERFTAGTQRRSLFLMAFCRTLIDLSNATFNHQSMSFKPDSQRALDFDADLHDVFFENLNFILDGARQNPTGQVSVVEADSRRLCRDAVGKADCVVTSPPYVNRMSYIRELRPYMYWLGYLVNSRDAGEMDWEAIGGTWGIATSRLSNWAKPSGSFESELLQSACRSIENGNNKNGRILANYILKYFDDIWNHLQSLTGVLNNAARIHYIVGNSTFYGVLVAAEKIYAEMLSELGFHDVECVPIRKRNSKKELIEFDVQARWR